MVSEDWIQLDEQEEATLSHLVAHRHFGRRTRYSLGQKPPPQRLQIRDHKTVLFDAVGVRTSWKKGSSDITPSTGDIKSDWFSTPALSQVWSAVRTSSTRTHRTLKRFTCQSSAQLFSLLPQ